MNRKLLSNQNKNYTFFYTTEESAIQFGLNSSATFIINTTLEEKEAVNTRTLGLKSIKLGNLNLVAVAKSLNLSEVWFLSMRITVL